MKGERGRKEESPGVVPALARTLPAKIARAHAGSTATRRPCGQGANARQKGGQWQEADAHLNIERPGKASRPVKANKISTRRTIEPVTRAT